MFSLRFRSDWGVALTLLTIFSVATVLQAQDKPAGAENRPSDQQKTTETRPEKRKSPGGQSVTPQKPARQERVTVRDSRKRTDGRESRERSRKFHESRRGLTTRWPDGVWYGYAANLAGDQLIETYRAARTAERYERNRRFNERDMAARKERLLAQHEQAVRAGLRRMKAGQYPQALTAFTLAARLNQGDAACRIHLGQTQLALGHYLEAGTALRRALELQPQLIYIDLHLAQYYSEEREFDDATDKLSDWLRTNAAEPEIYFLYGYLEFQRGNFGKAYRAFSRVQPVLPKDTLTAEYLELTKPASL